MTDIQSIEERWKHMKIDYKSRCDAAAVAAEQAGNPTKADAIRESLSFLNLPTPTTTMKLLRYESLARRFESEWR